MTHPYESPGQGEPTAKKSKPLRFLLWTAGIGFAIPYVVCSLVWTSFVLSGESTSLWMWREALFIGVFGMARHSVGFATVISTAITIATATAMVLTAIAKRISGRRKH